MSWLYKSHGNRAMAKPVENNSRSFGFLVYRRYIAIVRGNNAEGNRVRKAKAEKMPARNMFFFRIKWYERRMKNSVGMSV